MQLETAAANPGDAQRDLKRQRPAIAGRARTGGDERDRILRKKTTRSQFAAALITKVLVPFPGAIV